ncbi:nitroreductase family protein [uncultured Bacteroides sp.]|uniref:nitroreductase family protein n=1 Tax=uncultured Bacteroides sp. TaxID=162156 RepID=UPI002AA71526|nr:nitroreductase family protein [uncultured Bacteroides sp.]
MDLKNTINSLLPLKIRSTRSLFLSYYYDYKRYCKYAVFGNRIDSEKQFRGVLTYHYHVIEKGLTMPEPRLGFAKEKISFLIHLCERYMDKKYDLSALAFIHSVEILNEYVKFHVERNYLLDDDVVLKIHQLSKYTGIQNFVKQSYISRDVFFAHRRDSFDLFSMSRHTVRNYSSKKIQLDILHRCVELAQNTPSACNRQPNRVYIVKNRDAINSVLSLQNGNRGFGNLADALIVFTSEISVFRESSERHEAYLNSGMYIMTFINALHYHEIGSCSLNWSVSARKDKALRKLLNIPASEAVCMILSCGYVPDFFHLASSPKASWKEICIDVL